MRPYQRAFLEFALEARALRFGQFQLKSGRTSPYFFNAGLFDTGSHLAQLGRLYADAIRDQSLQFDMLFGPAYKGIPLAAAIAIALADHHGVDCPYAFNRKEAKDHGEGGTIVGRALSGRVLIVDDVITAGTSVRESIDIIRAQGAEPAGVVIALDRKERGVDERSAVAAVREAYSIPVVAIATLDELLELLEDDGGSAVDESAETLEAMRAYRAEFGVG